MTDSCIRTESQSFPLAQRVCQAFLYWKWVVLAFQVPRGLALSVAHQHSSKASTEGLVLTAFGNFPF